MCNCSLINLTNYEQRKWNNHEQFYTFSFLIQKNLNKIHKLPILQQQNVKLNAWERASKKKSVCELRSKGEIERENIPTGGGPLPIRSRLPSFTSKSRLSEQLAKDRFYSTFIIHTFQLNLTTWSFLFTEMDKDNKPRIWSYHRLSVIVPSALTRAEEIKREANVQKAGIRLVIVRLLTLMAKNTSF